VFAGLAWLAALGGAVAPGFPRPPCSERVDRILRRRPQGRLRTAGNCEDFRALSPCPITSLGFRTALAGQPRSLGIRDAKAWRPHLADFSGAKDPQNAEFLLPQVIGCDLVHLGVGTRRGCQELLGFRSSTCAALSPHRALPASTNARPRGRRWCWLHESPTSAIPSAADIGVGLSRRDARRRGHQPASRFPHRLEQAVRRLPVSAQARAGPPGGRAGGYGAKRCRPCGRD